MHDTVKPLPPENVAHAVRILWLWLLFLAFSGVYEGWASAPPLAAQLAQVMPEFAVSERTLFYAITGGYIFVAATMIGVVIKTARGKNWGRITLALSFLLDLAISGVSSYDGIVDYIITAVDIALQAYALWLLFTGPGRAWFHQKG